MFYLILFTTIHCEATHFSNCLNINEIMSELHSKSDFCFPDGTLVDLYQYTVYSMALFFVTEEN